MAVHIFREHNNKADAWAEKGVRGRPDREDDWLKSCLARGWWELWVLWWEPSERRMRCKHVEQHFQPKLWDGPQFTLSVGRCQVRISSTLKSLAVQC